MEFSLKLNDSFYDTLSDLLKKNKSFPQIIKYNQSNRITIDEEISSPLSRKQTFFEINRHLTVQDWEMLLQDTKYVQFSSGQIILEDGQSHDHLMQIASGIVRIEKEVDGKTLILNTLMPGDIFGEVAFLTVIFSSKNLQNNF